MSATSVLPPEAQVAILGFTTLMQWLGGKKQDSAARENARLYNEAAERQLEYDDLRYDAVGDQIRANYEWAVKETNTKRRNDRRAVNLQNANNARNYTHQLAIRNREQAHLDAQFEKSNALYNEQIGLNAQIAKTAEESEWRKLDEINAEAAFDAQDQRLKNLVEEGKIRAKGQSGRSISKSHQAIAANFGQQIAALNEGLASGARNTKAMINEIRQDKYSANLAAFAQKMLDPGDLPMPVMPFKIEYTEFNDPMPLQEFHFGPRPVKGATMSESAAVNQVWGTTIASMANTFSNAANIQWN